MQKKNIYIYLCELDGHFHKKNDQKFFGGTVINIRIYYCVNSDFHYFENTLSTSQIIEPFLYLSFFVICIDKNNFLFYNIIYSII